jgi:hypothetical protein
MPSQGPYLVLVAFWQDDPDVAAVAEAVSREKFPQPHGYPHGSVVAFRREVAAGYSFQHDLARFDLAGLEPPKEDE